MIIHCKLSGLSHSAPKWRTDSTTSFLKTHWYANILLELSLEKLRLIHSAHCIPDTNDNQRAACTCLPAAWTLLIWKTTKIKRLWNKLVRESCSKRHGCLSRRSSRQASMGMESLWMLYPASSEGFVRSLLSCEREDKGFEFQLETTARTRGRRWKTNLKIQRLCSVTSAGQPLDAEWSVQYDISKPLDKL